MFQIEIKTITKSKLEPTLALNTLHSVDQTLHDLNGAAWMMSDLVKVRLGGNIH